MSDSSGDIRLVIRLDGTVETEAGMKLTAEQTKRLGEEISKLGGQVKTTTGELDKAGKSAAEAGKGIAIAGQAAASGEWATAATQVWELAAAATGVSAASALMATGVGIAVVATAAMGVAAYKGDQEARAFGDALILTGNYAALAAGDIDRMAKSVSESVNSTVGSARDVLAELVSSGRFTRDELVQVAGAIQLVARFSGQSEATVTKQFEGMADGAAKWAVKMNEKYHFLTSATYDYIRSLEEQGRKSDAMRVASKALSDHLGNDMTRNLGLVAWMLHNVEQKASEAWAALKQLGKPADLQEQIATQERAVANLVALRERGGLAADSMDPKIAAARQYLDLLRAQRVEEQANLTTRQKEQKADEERFKAQAEWEKITKSNRSKKEREDADIENIVKTGQAMKLSQAEIDGQVRKYRELHAEKARATTQDQTAANYLAQLTRQLRGASGETSSYADALDYVTRNSAKFSAAQRAEALAIAQRIDAQRIKRQVDEAELKYLEQVGRERDKANDAWADEAAAMRQEARDREFEISLIGKTAEEMARLTAAREVEARSRKARGAVLDDFAEGRINEGQLRQRLSFIDQNTAEAMTQRTALLDQQFKPGWQKLLEGWSNTTQLMKDAYNNAMDGILRAGEDMWVKLATTGKLSVRDMVNGVIAEMARLTFRQNLASPLMSLAGNLIGAFFGGGTGDPDGSYTRLENTRLGVKHTGGIVGANDAGSRWVSAPAMAQAFSGAPRFHGGGIAADEVPIIAQKGEGIFTREQMAALSPAGGTKVDVQVHNYGGAQVQVKQRQDAAGALRLDVLIDHIDEAMADRVQAGSGTLARAFEGRYGLRTAVA